MSTFPAGVEICARWICIDDPLGGQSGRSAPVPYPTAAGGTFTGERWCGRHFPLLGAELGTRAIFGDRLPGLEHVIDRRRRNYERLGYYLRTAIRYFVAIMCFQYGIMKLFSQQMVAPSLSQLATPLGDFGPMRMAWMYMGYGSPYQIFAGAAEVVAGLLLFYRRTVTLGILTALGVFINVAIMNLTYDIPVKGFSLELTLCCLFLLVWDHQRLFSFLGLNQPTGGTRLYEPVDSGRGMRIARLVLKLYFVYAAIWQSFDFWGGRYLNQHKPAMVGPIRKGVYAVRVFAVNQDTIPPSFMDSVRWKDVIFDSRRSGSVNSSGYELYAEVWVWARGCSIMKRTALLIC
jgi:hypothetical protein